jgi:hypothetical protein
MPAPSPSEIEDLARGALRGAGLDGENVPDLAAALGQFVGQALALFAATAIVAPGIPAAAPPPANSGSTVGPGLLLPPPAGGPVASQLEGIAASALAARRLDGDGRGALARVLAGVTAQAIALFTTTVMVAPGVAIAGLTTTAPGALMGAAPAAPALRPIAAGLAQAEGLRGARVPDLAGALAETLANALSAFLTRVKVAPGIPCTPAATAAPGRLV